jgi:hypothetical protein
MKRTRYTPNFMGSVEPFEGESIEKKVSKLVENNEPITDGAPIIYTEKKDGVLPQYDIRTDKWDIAQSAMDLANASKIAKSKGMKKPEEQQEKTEQQQITE